MEKQKIDRINELAHLKKQRALTKEEAEEQRVLREEFLADFRAAFRQQLDQIELVDPDDPRLKKRNN